MLKVTQLFLCATQSPVSSTMFNIIQQIRSKLLQHGPEVLKHCYYPEKKHVYNARVSHFRDDDESTLSKAMKLRDWPEFKEAML